MPHFFNLDIPRLSYWPPKNRWGVISDRWRDGIPVFNREKASRYWPKRELNRYWKTLSQDTDGIRVFWIWNKEDQSLILIPTSSSLLSYSNSRWSFGKEKMKGRVIARREVIRPTWQSLGFRISLEFTLLPWDCHGSSFTRVSQWLY